MTTLWKMHGTDVLIRTPSGGLAGDPACCCGAEVVTSTCNTMHFDALFDDGVFTVLISSKTVMPDTSASTGTLVVPHANPDWYPANSDGSGCIVPTPTIPCCNAVEGTYVLPHSFIDARTHCLWEMPLTSWCNCPPPGPTGGNQIRWRAFLNMLGGNLYWMSHCFVGNPTAGPYQDVFYRSGVPCVFVGPYYETRGIWTLNKVLDTTTGIGPRHVCIFGTPCTWHAPD